LHTEEGGERQELLPFFPVNINNPRKIIKASIRSRNKMNQDLKKIKITKCIKSFFSQSCCPKMATPAHMTRAVTSTKWTPKGQTLLSAVKG